jgi:hypothetical protein
MTAYHPGPLYHLVETPSSRFPRLPAPPPLDLDTPLVMPDLATLARAVTALRAARCPRSPIRGKPHMTDQPKPKVTDLIPREANVAGANQNPVAAHALRQVADEMDNTKNGSVPPEAP